jgi:hypothetical protein
VPVRHRLRSGVRLIVPSSPPRKPASARPASPPPTPASSCLRDQPVCFASSGRGLEEARFILPRKF